MAAVPALYIADGHHRAASAARARVDIRDRGITRTSLGDGADYTTFLGVAFPDTDVRILAYNRAVSSLGHHSLESFMEAVRARFDVQPGPPMPRQRGDISMLIDNAWHTIRPRARAADAPLDVTMLERELLAPVLDITDIRTDKRIEFVGSARGVGPLEERVASGRAAVAFSLFPVSVSDLMAVCDAGGIMPPKSTWFEPKLCDGLLIHLI
jgi:uncharacterized protein (DUF1015 family)